MIDHLPGILGRGEYKDALKRALAAEETLTLGHLDVDQFLEINEQRGEEAGDQLLLLLAEALHEAAQAGGWVVGRIGGDEFSICMPGVTLEKGFLQMEALRQELARRAGQAYTEFSPTFSIGVANYPRDAKDVTGLMRQADTALYQVKEAGRNAVGLPSREEMILRSCYYNASQLARLKKLAEQLKKKESVLLREALDDLLRKYDVK
ncbi:MAG: diguanylate cyclase domain-containing protein [Bacillota bacterium]